MKHLVLLMFFCLVAGVTAYGQATYTIDWQYPDTLHASQSESYLKRVGVLRNLNSTAKQILFRYNIEQVAPGHTVAFCFGDLCYFQFPGADDPYERDPQDLAPNGTLPVYSLCNNTNVEASSTVWYEMFDKTDTTDALPFTITYIFGNPASVTDARELGISLYPVPATNQVRVSGTGDVMGVNLYNSTGILVRTYVASFDAELTLDVSDMPNGAYHLVLSLRGGRTVQAPFTISR